MGWSMDPEVPDTMAIAYGLRIRRTVMFFSLPDVIHCSSERADQRYRIWQKSHTRTILDRMERKRRSRPGRWKIDSRFLVDQSGGVLELTATWEE